MNTVPPRHARRWIAGLGTLAAFATAWSTFLQPMLIQAVAAEAAEHLDAKVAAAVNAEVQPLAEKVNASNAGLKAIIASAIAALERDVDRLEYIRDYPPPDDWTDEFRRQLFETEDRLRVQQAALSLIEGAE